MSKKIITLLLAGVMMLSLAACGAKEAAPAPSAPSAPAASAPAAETTGLTEAFAESPRGGVAFPGFVRYDHLLCAVFHG